MNVLGGGGNPSAWTEPGPGERMRFDAEGQVADVATFAFGNDWIGLRTTDDSLLKAVSRVPLFGGFLGLGLLLMAIGAMWYREGR